MARDLLNSVPDWALEAIFIAGTVIVTFAALALVHRLLPAWRESGSGDKVVGVAAMVMTLFALVLAFVVVNLNNSYETVSSNVNGEASSLAEMVLDARVFPARARHAVDLSVARYVREVVDHEFAELRHGREDPEAQRRYYAMFGALQSYSPVTRAQTTFYNSAVGQLGAVVTERRDRLDAAETTIPSPLFGLMILLAVMTLVTTIFVKTNHVGIDLVLVFSVAVVVGAGLLTAAILEYPFSGSIAVSSNPYERGVLAQVTSQYH